MSTFTAETHQLVTPAQLQALHLDGLADDLEAADELGAVSAVCDWASGLVCGELGYQVHIHAATLHWPAWTWELADHESYSYQRWLERWPLVLVTDGKSVEAGELHQGGQILFANDAHQTLTGIFGFRREDETLSELQARTGMSDLASLPASLPHAIVEVTSALALFRIKQRMAGNVTGSRTTQTVGGGTFTVDPSPERFIRSQLDQLAPYRKLW